MPQSHFQTLYLAQNYTTSGLRTKSVPQFRTNCQRVHRSSCPTNIRQRASRHEGNALSSCLVASTDDLKHVRNCLTGLDPHFRGTWEHWLAIIAIEASGAMDIFCWCCLRDCQGGHLRCCVNILCAKFQYCCLPMKRYYITAKLITHEGV